MFTQGKWYAGEILPRWALWHFWRVDNQPIWQDSKWLADPDKPLSHDLTTARQFTNTLAEKLGIPANYVIAAREDTPYYLWQAGKLPLQDELMAADVYEQRERQRLQALLEKNLNAPAGYVLPLHYSHRRGQWISNAWQFSRPHLILLTGDSPLGLRLPLTSLALPAEADEEICPERSPFAATEPLPSHDQLQQSIAKVKVDDSCFKADPNGLVRTALSAEVRNGVLHLFLPPVAWAEHFLTLIAVIEAVCVKLKTPVVLEGYTPPQDKRLVHFSVTPDPGVLEVNVQPAASWQQLKTITQTVYQEARLVRLSAEKFLLDGRRSGTGGGNHIVLGAAQPEHSPFLRRPDLLRSLVCFWQHHPALSYLFAGQYIGPTSQSPRIDEARHDALHELEIAFQQIPTTEQIPCWLVDRLFRNLLVDLTGNTHRAEFCIDKLYSPDSDRGRLGLLEMRGFEMSPHPQMNLVQALLLRACIALFWQRPYQARLVRWGTRLHDRFMLPYYLQQDLYDVLDFLKAGGYHFAPEWFIPFFDFRFPLCGQVQIGDMSLSLRYALEPWPVMGEEMQGSSMSRAVDATVERIEVRAQGLTEGHHILTCNGRRVPLTATAKKGLQVAGVRFKAWGE
jgi:uncharacterized protein (DUF2126 family)